MSMDDHPLLLELTSLRQTAARFQHEAHAAAMKLQHHSLDSSYHHERTAALEQENERLTRELAILRSFPESPPHPAVAQVQQLSLALRRVSDKIVLTENTLLERTTELSDTRSELARARHTADAAYELAARMRAREEACKARERELELRVRASEEERKMVDLVVQEYADLVRNLEGRKSANHTPFVPNGSASTITLVDNLQNDRSALHRILTDFSIESEQLHAIIAELNTKISDLQVTLDTESITASHDRTLLSQTKTELDRINLEDQTAAKMVTRYMKFSQTSINALQKQIMTLQARNASTITTLELQLSIAESQLASERIRTARLQDALDELCEDLARESYGRRREVSLRLALLSREEGVAEFMRRWARRARESYARCYDSAQPPASRVSSENAVQQAFHRVVSDAESLLSAFDDDVQFSDATRTSASLARIALSMEAVEALRSELQGEVQKRVEAIRKNALAHPNGHTDGTASRIGDLSPPEGAPSHAAEHLSIAPNSNAIPDHVEPLVESPPSQDAHSPLSTRVGAAEEPIDDPFVVPLPTASPIAETAEHTITQRETSSSPSPSIRDSAPILPMLLVDDEPKIVQPYSPAVSTLDLQQDIQPSCAERPSTTDAVAINALPNGSFIPSSPEANQDTQILVEDSTPIPSTPISTLMEGAQNAQVLAEDDTPTPPTSIPIPTHAISEAPLVLQSPFNSPRTLLSELGATKHRYETLRRDFRDCSLALKELRRSFASSSPSLQIQTNHRQHLETALARIDDYIEDARVELEIRVADEELTARGLETVLSVPGALVDADERAEVETSARSFVDGTDEGVTRTLEKFGKKLEDVQHDVAVVKLAVHGLTMEEGEDGEGGDGNMDAGAGGDSGAGWTAWTAGLLGANATPSRSPTPMQTFGAVVTSPRLRHAASLKQLHGQTSEHAHESPDRGPLAGLNLRVPMPSLSPSYPHLGFGHAMEGPTRPRTLSTMYAVGGLRSSVGFGVGLGGSPSPARARGVIARLGALGSASPPLRAGDGVRGNAVDDVRDGEVHDHLGGVE